MKSSRRNSDSITDELASLHIHPIAVPKRTEGDGMENSSTVSDATVQEQSDSKHEIKTPVVSPPVSQKLRDQFIYRPEDLKKSSLLPPVITGKLVHLVPKNMTLAKKEGTLMSTLNAREPKFVPYEPYKAAVKPIIPYDKLKKKRKSKLSGSAVVETRSSPDEDQSNSRRTSVNSVTKTDNSTKTIISENCNWQEECSVLETKLKELKAENEQLESQLKYQAQVNGDLKNLLVAAVGEDLETRVHILTEDKLQLARALLNSAQKLSTHQEQTEWLAGQCEVWRSKFLASSIMVEELAKWKAALCQEATDLQEGIKRLIEERATVRESLINTYKDLSVLCDNFDVTSLRGIKQKLNSSNIVDVAAANVRLSSVLRLQLLGEKAHDRTREPDLTGLETTTPAERSAEQLLYHQLPLLSQDDAAYSAVMGAAVALGINHLFSTPAPACCGHCSGEVKNV